MDKIDWSKAPEGATHYAPETHENRACWIIRVAGSSEYVTVEEFKKRPSSFVWLSGDIMESDEFIVPRPQPLTYTQAMAGKGELPSVGMEFIYCDSTNTKNNSLVTYISEWNIVFKCLDDGFSKDVELAKEISELDIARQMLPITPPIELIDGKTYQFELCFGDYRVGYYCSVRNSFFDGLLKTNKICGKSEATNIQPLTVRE
jgi:hypothetical protein